MTPLRLLPALGLLLAGCGSAAPQPASDSPELAACRAEAAQSTGVRNAYGRVVIGLASSEERYRQEAAQAESSAFSDCLRRRGLARGGGVEPVRRPRF